MFILNLLLLLSTFFNTTSSFTADVQQKPNKILANYLRVAIVNGVKSRPRPFYVRVQLPPDGSFCGGAIIDPNWIVTAAHCVDDYMSDNLLVEVGDFSDEDEVYTVYRVQKLMLHNSYRPGNRPFYDLALLKLTEPITVIPGTNDCFTLIMCPSTDTYDMQLASCGMGATNRSITNVEYADHLRELYFRKRILPMNPFDFRPSSPDLISVDPVAPFSGMCHLDEGGPLYIFNSETLKPVCLLGIFSYSVPDPDTSPDERCNGRDFFASVPEMYAFIEFTITIDSIHPN